MAKALNRTIGFALTPLLLLAGTASAQENTGNECAVGSTNTGAFVAGWFHNRPLYTTKQDGVWPNPAAGVGTIRYWDAGQTGADTAVVGSAGNQTMGPGISIASQTSTTNFIGVNGAGSTFAQAVADGDYVQQSITTPATLNPRTFFERTGLGLTNNENYNYAVRVSTDPNFATYWTIEPGRNVTFAGGYTFRTARTAKFPFLRPSTTYYIRLYAWNRTGGLANAPAGSIGFEDFQIGTAVCPLPTVTVTKISNNGIGRFSFTGTNGFTDQDITTTTAGTGMAGATQVMSATNTATTINETAPPAGFILSGINCTGLASGIPAYTVNGATGGNVQLPAAAMTSTANIACTFTNTRVTALTVTKVSDGGTGTFNFSGTNGVANHAITTAAAGGAGTAGAQQTLTAAATATAITEAVPPAGWSLTAATCTVTPPGGTAAPATGTFDAALRTFNLTAADTAAGSAIACTFTNQAAADVSITKTNTEADGPSDQVNDTVTAGATTTYQLIVTNHSAAAVTGVVVRDTPVAGMTCAGANTVNIDYSGATPDATSTVGALTGANGIVLGALGSGETATVRFDCTVN